MRNSVVVSVCIVLLTLLATLGVDCRRDSERVEVGPQFVCFIVDSSASVSGFQAKILEYAQLALDYYSRQGPLKVTVINLNESPTVEFQTARELFEEDIPEVINQVKAIDYDAKGTDIISAMELASQYYGYERMPPSDFKLLCFTDGRIEGMSSQSFRQWADFDWTKLQEQGAEIGLYFIVPDPKLRAQVEASLQGFPSAIIRNAKEAEDDLSQEEPDLP